MNEFRTKLETLTRQAYPSWDEARARSVRHAAARTLARRQVNRKRVRVAGLALAGVGAAALVLWLNVTTHEATPATATETERFLTFPGGARAELLNARADVTLRQGFGKPLVEVSSGRVRFFAEGKDLAEFSVVSHSVRISVMTARFVVESRDEGTFVAVEDGQAKVRWSQGSVTLAQGTSGIFPPSESVTTTSDQAASESPHAADTPAKVSKTNRSWRRLAESGRYRAAYVQLQSEGARAVQDEPADLLLAADVARLSGHAEQAVGPLERLISRHPRDVRAASAAFTLGKLLVEKLNAPLRGATYFAEVRRLSPKGPLAQAALARQAEALHRAGHRRDAVSLAQAYVREYPHGPHLEGLRALEAAP